MPVTVADLVADPALDLVLHTPGRGVDRPVSWVHVSELTDPTPFLEGGELLLTTGLALRGEPVGEYVARLAAAGVVGLGLGTGLGVDTVPADLVAVAQRAGLALLEVPRRTPFIALSRNVSAALAADEYAALARAATAQQELTRAALAPGSPAPLLQRLARQVGGWVLLLDTAGAVLEAVPATAAGHAEVLRPELDRLRSVRAPASAALSAPGETVLLQSLGNERRTRGFLVVGRPGPVHAADRSVVNAAVGLLTLRLEQSRGLDSAMAALRAALLRMLLAGEEAAVGEAVAALGERLPAEPLQVLVVLGAVGQRAAAVDVAADAAAVTGSPSFSAELDDDALVLLVASDGPLPERLVTLPDRVPQTAVGVAGPVPWGRLADGVRQARQAAEHSRARGGGLAGFAELAGRGLPALLDPAATRAFADALLAPLVAADRAGAGDLVDSLRAWLSHHGQWEPAAAALGVHRHTLRKRMKRAGDLLGRDLDEPGTRAELWLALHPPA
ncbi:purine catabolism regulatory protein [Geodermatophilus obscurus]|uniref:Purine catabolism regulatory protein n=1 Tax=Geodermatophilus obscurus TaxID=1861 RepID=A0A1I5HZE1_9ACTN|nr:PucR family transcriptional regulator [Geodermatophilus obscurus]SFO53728.1 purine catabolism regulatory protein [Geodermatophilus obscurus]